MAKNSPVYNKAFSFAISIVNLYKHLTSEKKEYVLSRQLLRSGTSIGANVKEALQAQSKRDFLAKMSIALKEAAETEYWLKLLIATDYLDHQKSQSILNDCKELNRLLISIVKTTRENLNQ